MASIGLNASRREIQLHFGAQLIGSVPRGSGSKRGMPVFPAWRGLREYLRIVPEEAASSDSQDNSLSWPCEKTSTFAVTKPPPPSHEHHGLFEGAKMASASAKLRPESLGTREFCLGASGEGSATVKTKIATEARRHKTQREEERRRRYCNTPAGFLSPSRWHSQFVDTRRVQVGWQHEELTRCK